MVRASNGIRFSSREDDAVWVLRRNSDKGGRVYFKLGLGLGCSLDMEAGSCVDPSKRVVRTVSVNFCV
jgi:hypothetical protein